MRKPTPFCRKFIANVRARREELGLSQAEVARRLGVVRPQYARIENGGATPGIDFLNEISQALETEPAELLPHSPAAA